MRLKKQIVIVCLFTFLFLPFSYEKEVKANPLAYPITYGVKEVITAILLYCGIVLTDGDTHYGMMDEIYEREYEKVKALASGVATGERVTIGSDIIDTIKEVYNLTYSDEILTKEYYTTEFGQHILKNVDSGKSVYNIYFINNAQYYCFYRYSPVTFTGPTGFYEMVLNRTGDFVSVEVWKNGVRYLATGGGDIEIGLKSADGSIIEGAKVLTPDWTAFRETNKDLDIDDTTSKLVGGSICVDGTLSSDWEETWSPDDTKYPLDKNYQGNISVNVDDVLDKPSIDDVETPTTDNSLWNTLFGWLKTLLSPLTKLLGSIWDLIKGLFDMLKGLLTSILDLLKTLVQALIDAICALFVPTLAFEDVFKINQNTFFGQIVEFFNFNKLWDITPKPLAVDVEMPFYNFATQEKTPYKFEIKFFENKFMKENINLIRNVITYPLLISVAYFIILHFMPKRDID